MLATAAAIGLYFLCTGLGAYLLVRPLELRANALRETTNTGAQAIVVLAAGRYAYAPEFGGEEIPDYVALARLHYAAKLYHDTGLPILVSGGNGSSDGQLKPKAVAMAKSLQQQFTIPVKWVEPASETTAENAIYSARMLKPEGIRRILLVTDAMHMTRSEQRFRAAGFDVVPAPTIFFSEAKLNLFDLLPTAENLWQSYYATYEWMALIRDELADLV
ncbi:Uncharacterized SAM-binding protein YcdF, DUF218 family [Noviherbaspirillum humi]|uniref:Uncharacterized SAM-binding protein YcdF, DUF218 family n=2 Tax=Noviherbaspirillum humi TaxID=1688639 RepID=A0A239HL41_9BURK|nr:Uncharacterized SAM-binding protein YcdF, DUF218 family [Noviherbaspirillum humi]